MLVLVLPKTPDSLNLISADELNSMKPSAILVNVARGGIVDECALVEALKAGKIAGAGTDVFLKEPAGSQNSILMQAESDLKPVR